ncbi:hypothetical protein M9H77_22667 [Catharanthus roseus]|uniref:Uncharacterized protein n=1 Tax=Catharanthus roseus TaxID=4058 RepID=A0ACC0ATA1_CATRO|nr:hypothetical protein M9H77_22667 [Catharanthus roseus]
MLTATVWEFQLLQCGVDPCVSLCAPVPGLQSEEPHMIYIFHLGVGQPGESPMSEEFRLLQSVFSGKISDAHSPLGRPSELGELEINGNSVMNHNTESEPGDLPMKSESLSPRTPPGHVVEPKDVTW